MHCVWCDFKVNKENLGFFFITNLKCLILNRFVCQVEK